MSRGVNKTILIGHIGADPEFRVTPNNVQVANLRIATTEQWKDRQSGERQERTEWHRVVCFNRLAEIANDHLEKGKQIYLEGKLQTRKWQDQQGNDRYTTEIVAMELQMLGGNGGQPNASRGTRGAQQQGASGSAPSRPQGRQGGSSDQPPRSSNSSQRTRQPETADAGPPVDDFDDDIPF